MPRWVTKTKIAQSSTGGTTWLEDLVLTEMMAEGRVHGSSIYGKMERERCIGPGGKDGFKQVRTTELTMSRKCTSLNWLRA